MSVLHVVFRVENGEYVLPASAVLHMETFVGATRVPGAQPHVLGLVQVRSRVLPVIDLRLRFGLPTVDSTLDSRILVVQQGARVVGLLADSAREVLRIEPAQFHAPPELVVEQSAGFVTHVAEIGPRLVMLIDTGKVIGEEPAHGEHER
ncbi:MAG: putative chemotaxis protein CheW [Myxococcaceae bacterium]|nr:putative chemotaxis protein CheW [Myxococcaceae bacterium]